MEGQGQIAVRKWRRRRGSVTEGTERVELAGEGLGDDAFSPRALLRTRGGLWGYAGAVTLLRLFRVSAPSAEYGDQRPILFVVTLHFSCLPKHSIWLVDRSAGLDARSCDASGCWRNNKQRKRAKALNFTKRTKMKLVYNM